MCLKIDPELCITNNIIKIMYIAIINNIENNKLNIILICFLRMLWKYQDSVAFLNKSCSIYFILSIDFVC